MRFWCLLFNKDKRVWFFLVNNDCGDFPFKDLISIRDNKIVSKLLIESDSWDIEKGEEGTRDEIIHTFNINNSLNIEVNTIEKLNGEIKLEVKDTYRIVDGKFF